MLSTLPAKIEKNIMRTALRAGANVIKVEAKKNVPIQSGDLKKSIKVSTNAKRGRVSASIKAGDKKAWYYLMVEFGTLAHAIQAKKGKTLKFVARDGKHISTKSVMHSGAISKPYMRPALDNKASEAIEAVGWQISRRLTKEGLETPSPLQVDY